MQHIQVLALVFVDALDLDVEEPAGGKLDAGVLADVVGKRLPVGLLDRAPVVAEPTHAPAAPFICTVRLAAPVYVGGDVGLVDLPGIAVVQPFIGDFRLPAVMDFLVEATGRIADAVADGRALQCRQRVEITGCQPAQAAVAQARLFLAGQDDIEVLAKLGQRRT